MLRNMWLYDFDNVTLTTDLQKHYMINRFSHKILEKTELSDSYVFIVLQVFWMWILNSIFHSILLFWMPVLALQQGEQN